jgi:hypothetical protein
MNNPSNEAFAGNTRHTKPPFERGCPEGAGVCPADSNVRQRKFVGKRKPPALRATPFKKGAKHHHLQDQFVNPVS